VIEPDPRFWTYFYQRDFCVTDLSYIPPGIDRRPARISSLPYPSKPDCWRSLLLRRRDILLQQLNDLINRSLPALGLCRLPPVTHLFAGSTAGFAVNFAAETAGIVGFSHLFTKQGTTSSSVRSPLLNIGCSAAAISFDLAYR
jgi:hypothetical protein